MIVSLVNADMLQTLTVPLLAESVTTSLLNFYTVYFLQNSNVQLYFWRKNLQVSDFQNGKSISYLLDFSDRKKLLGFINLYMKVKKRFPADYLETRWILRAI